MTDHPQAGARVRIVYDDETSLACLTVVHRAGLPADARYTINITHTPADAKSIGQQIGQALRRHRRGPEGM